MYYLLMECEDLLYLLLEDFHLYEDNLHPYVDHLFLLQPDLTFLLN